MTDSHVHEYPEARVLMSKTGEIMVGLPIYANHAGSFFDSNEMDKIVGVSLSMGMYEKIGYVVFHPDLGEIILNNLEKLGIEDLGLLGESCPEA